MLEVGENLALHHEAPQDRVSVHAPVDQFDGDLFVILIIGADSKKNRAHPPMTDLTNDLVRANSLSGSRLFSLGLQLSRRRNDTCIDQGRGVKEGPRVIV